MDITGDTVPMLSERVPQTTLEKLKRFAGIFLALFAALSHAVTSLILKALSNHHPLTVSTWRFLGMLIPTVFVFLIYTCLPTTRRNGWMTTTFGFGTPRKIFKMILLILFRGILGCTGTIVFICAVDRISIADASAIHYIYPVFVILLAHCIIGEKALWSSVPLAILAVIGVIIISRPQLLTGQSSVDKAMLVGILYAFSSNIMFTVVVIILRFLKDVNSSFIMLIHGITAGIICVSLAAIYGVLDAPHGTKDWTLAGGLLLFNFLSHGFLVLALKFEKAGMVSMVQAADVIFTFMLQYIFLGVPPDGYSVLGAVIIISSVCLAIIHKSVQLSTDDGTSNLRQGIQSD